MGASESAEKLSSRTLYTYTQAQAGLNLVQTLLLLHLFYFYSDRRGLSPELTGLVFFIACGLDAVTDPLMGNISDRARFKMGRRRPFFLAAIPTAVCVFLLLSPPDLHRGIFAWFLIFYFLMLTSRKIYETAYGALMPELTLDYDERTKLSTFRQMFATLGDVGGALLPFIAAYFFSPAYDFKFSGAVAAIVIGGSAINAMIGLRERHDFGERERFSFIESIKSAGNNRPFLILLVTTGFAVIGANIFGTLLRFVAKYWMLDEGAASRWLIAYFAGAIVSYPFWFRITLRIEKKLAFVVATLCSTAALLLFWVVTPGDRLTIYLIMAFYGFSGVGVWVSLMSASADVIEWDEERTGRRQEGAYGGLISMVTKLAIALSMIMIGPMMSLSGYAAGAPSMSPAAAENLHRLFAIAPAAAFFLSAAVFMFYPITRESHGEMRERLAARAAAAKQIAS